MFAHLLYAFWLKGRVGEVGFHLGNDRNIGAGVASLVLAMLGFFARVFGGGGNVYGILSGVVMRTVFVTLYRCFVMANRTFVFGCVGRHTIAGDMLDFLIGVGGNFGVYHRFYLTAIGTDIFCMPMVAAINVMGALFKAVTVLAGVSARRKNKKRAPHTKQQ